MNTQLTRWNPFKEMEQLQNRLGSFWNWDPLRTNGKQELVTLADWSPNVDIVEDQNEFLIKADLPEMKREDVKITVEDGVLTFSGERRQEKEEKNKRFHRIESAYGSFARAFTLPTGTFADKVTAEFKDGVLKIHLPKDVKASSAKTVEIKAT